MKIDLRCAKITKLAQRLAGTQLKEQEGTLMISDLTSQLAETMAIKKDAIISEALDGICFINQDELTRRVRIERLPDGREIFLLDGEPKIEFYPIEINIQEGSGTISQKYRNL